MIADTEDRVGLGDLCHGKVSTLGERSLERSDPFLADGFRAFHGIARGTAVRSTERRGSDGKRNCDSDDDEAVDGGQGHY